MTGNDVSIFTWIYRTTFWIAFVVQDFPRRKHKSSYFIQLLNNWSVRKTYLLAGRQVSICLQPCMGSQTNQRPGNRAHALVDRKHANPHTYAVVSTAWIDVHLWGMFSVVLWFCVSKRKHSTRFGFLQASLEIQLIIIAGCILIFEHNFFSINACNARVFLSSNSQKWLKGDASFSWWQFCLKSSKHENFQQMI